MTHRQYLAWQAWMRLEWNRPSRTDHLIMRAAAEAYYSNRKHPDTLNLHQFGVTFEDRLDKPKAKRMTSVELARAKAAWKAALGPNAVIVETRSEADDRREGGGQLPV